MYVATVEQTELPAYLWVPVSAGDTQVKDRRNQQLVHHGNNALAARRGGEGASRKEVLLQIYHQQRFSSHDDSSIDWTATRGALLYVHSCMRNAGACMKVDMTPGR